LPLSGAEGLSAFTVLFDRWGIQYDFDGSASAACEFAQIHGLRCLNISDGSIRQLRALGRPTILTLADESGINHDAVMTGLGYDDVEIVIRGDTSIISLAELARYWRGAHTLLWRPHNPLGETLRRGMQSEGVHWLRDSLTGLQGSAGKTVPGEPTPKSVATYDADLERLVQDYQHERWLEADGVAGPQTQIALATELALDGVPILNWRQ